MKKRNISLQLNPENQSNALLRKEQDLLIGLISSIQMGLFADSLETGLNQQELRQLLATVLQFKQEASIIEMLSFLHNEGQRTAYSILLPYLLSTEDKKEVASTLRKHFFGIELFVHHTYHIFQFLDAVHDKNRVSIEREDLKRGILAWDMGQLVSLARVAYETGYIDETTAWEHIEFAGEQCRKAFRSWEEIGKSFLIGQAMKLTENREEEIDKAIKCFLLATESKDSPWKNTIYPD